MNVKKRTEVNRVKIFFAVLLFIITLFSITVSSVEKNHECSGDGCSVCYVIHVAEENVRLLKLCALFFVAAVIFWNVKNTAESIKSFPYKNIFSLIGQKVRLND